jgi:hypothetical protein
MTVDHDTPVIKARVCMCTFPTISGRIKQINAIKRSTQHSVFVSIHTRTIYTHLNTIFQMNVVNALNHVHQQIDTEHQWKRAVNGLMEMSSLDIANVWVTLSNPLLSMDEGKSIIIHSQLKCIFDRAVHQATLAKAADAQCDLSYEQLGQMLEKYRNVLEIYSHTLTEHYTNKGEKMPIARELARLANDNESTSSGATERTSRPVTPINPPLVTGNPPAKSTDDKLSEIQATLQTLTKSITTTPPTAADGGQPSAAVVAAGGNFKEFAKEIRELLQNFIRQGKIVREIAEKDIDVAQRNEDELRNATNQAMDSIHAILQEIPNTMRKAIADSDLSLIPQRIAELKLTMEEHSNQLVSSSVTTAEIMQTILEILSRLNPHILDTYDDITSINRELLRLNMENHDQLCDGLEVVKEILKPRLISIADEIKNEIEGEETLELDQEEMEKIKSIVDKRVEQGTQTLLETINEINEAADHGEQEDALVSNETQTTEPNTEIPKGGTPTTTPGSRQNRKTGMGQTKRNLTPAEAEKIEHSPYNRNNRISRPKRGNASSLNLHDKPFKTGRPHTPAGYGSGH